MANKIILRDELVKSLSAEVGLTQTRTKQLIAALEDILSDQLKTKGRVRIANFGTFYKRTRPSRVIKTVRERTPKIILEKEAIKFIAAIEFKQKLLGKKPRQAAVVVEKITAAPEAPQTQEIIAAAQPIVAKVDGADEAPSADQQIKIHVEQPKAAEGQKSSPIKKFKFPALSIYSRVEKEKIEKEIKERLLKLAQTAQIKPQLSQTEIAHFEKIFANFIKHAQTVGASTLDFSLSHDKPEKLHQTTIWAGRPRLSLGICLQYCFAILYGK